ncbi:hypothetical protein B0H13DRAFT_2276493, partial [Mycena leptocephala]
MSTITINGLAATSLGYHASARTQISNRFFSQLDHPNNSCLLVTSCVPGFPSCSTVLACKISSTAQYDVALGLDWAAHFRESFIALGYRLGDTFNPWSFFNDYHSSQNTGTHILTFNKNPAAPPGCQFKVVSFEPNDTPDSQFPPRSHAVPLEHPSGIPKPVGSRAPRDFDVPGPSNPK